VNPYSEVYRAPRTTANWQWFQGREWRLMADQRPILGPEAAVQRDEPRTVGLRQISFLSVANGCFAAPCGG
jgi:hypothetical protein